MQDTVAIRVDGNNQIGFGHLIRMQALAKQMEKLGARVIFMTRNPETIQYHSTITIDDEIDLYEEDRMVNSALKKHNAAMLIVDSYKYDKARLNQIGQLPLTSVYIDDLNRHPFDVDYVINGNLYAPSLNYQGRAQFLLGTEYLLLREEFADIARRKVRSSVNDVLLTFGAADPSDLTFKVLSILMNYDRFTALNWHVVLGPVFSNPAQVLELGWERTNVHYHHNPDIKRMMDLCDICISAAGSTTYELARCGVPSILVPAAENQLNVAREAHRLGIAYRFDLNEGMSDNKLFALLDSLINDYASRQKMAALGQEQIDGRGAMRVASILVSTLHKQML